MNAQEVENEIIQMMSNKITLDDSAQSSVATQLLSDIGVDSLSMMEFLIEIEEKYCVEWSEDKINEINTIRDITQYVMSAHEAPAVAEGAE